MDNRKTGMKTSSEYEKQKLLRSLEAFSRTARVPVTLFDKDMKPEWECLKEQKFCSTFSAHDNCNEECMRNLQRAAETARGMNEPYVFMCASELVGIIYPLTEGDRMTGVIMAGPVIRGKNKESAVRKLFRTLPDFRGYVNEVLELIDMNTVRSSAEMSCMYEVFCDCIFSYRLLKAEDVSDDTVLYNLKQSVERGNREGTATNLGLLYDRAYIASAGNVNRIKHSLSDSLQTMLEDPFFSGPVWKEVRNSTEELKDAVSNEQIKELIKMTAENMVSATGRPEGYRGRSPVIIDATRYLRENYFRDVDLREAAEAVHVNPSYLSALFRKETGLTFSMQLNIIRLEKSVELLRTTDMSLEEIAGACGFGGQSYFIRTFKKHYGQTPGKYRRK